MKCIEILEGPNKGTIMRVPDEQAIQLVNKEKKAKFVPKSRYKAILRGHTAVDKGGQ